MLADLITLREFSVTKKQVIDTRNNLSRFLLEGNVVEYEVEPLVVRKYRGDFNGLLTEIGVPPLLWGITLELNRIPNSVDYNGKKGKILLLDENTVISLVSQS